MTMAGATAAAVSEYDSMGEDPDEEAPPQSRKSYTIRQKRVMVFGVDKMVLSNAHTTSSACRVYIINMDQTPVFFSMTAKKTPNPMPGATSTT
jgi:hypothetical protein